MFRFHSSRLTEVLNVNAGDVNVFRSRPTFYDESLIGQSDLVVVAVDCYG